ncbi:MAG: SLC13 family permease [Ignavibacteriaceae bacterium]
MMTSIVVLTIVLLLIAVRQVENIRLQIWQIMSGGAIAVLITGQISPPDAIKSVNFDIIFFLLGMFIVGEALERSGYLSYLAYNFFKWAKNTDSLLLMIIFGMGLLSIFLMNDTVAIIGTPVVLILAEKNNLPPKLLLLALAFAVTIGSVMSPLGNPQNLLIAVNSNVNNIFAIFGKYLIIPTIINLLLAFFLLKFFYRNSFHKITLNSIPEKGNNRRLTLLSKLSLGIILFLVFLKIILLFLKFPIDFKLTYIALAAAMPIILFSNERVEIIKRVDWHTLIFFVSMFVLMQSVWNTGIFQNMLSKTDVSITSILMILAVSVVLSQLISNVPLVALYLPLLLNLGVSTKGLMALAAGSTIAGNLFIFGAASNIIIIQNAEKRGEKTLTFWEFSKVGIPLTIINFLIYYLYLRVL